jgi:2-beta-glucuronyltransferase
MSSTATQIAAQPAASIPDKPVFLVLSAHDYRSPRKANIHFPLYYR